MEITAPPLRSNLEEYEKFAQEIVRRWRSGNPEVIAAIKKHHPRLEKLSESDIGSAEFALADAQLVVARVHGFDSWPAFAKHIEGLTPDSSFSAIWKAAETALISGDVSTLEQLLQESEQLFRERQPPPYGPEPGRLAPEYSSGDARSIIARNHHFESWEKFTEYLDALKRKDSPIAQFEAAVDAIVTGEVDILEQLLREHPDLIRARSTRKHHATLLHYVGANGVEDFRQTTPKNAVKVLKVLLKAGAEVDAMADMYGGGCTTMGLVDTSIHPHLAGVQNELIETLVEAGAGLNDPGAINSCLAHGRPQVAESLALRGAPLDLEGAAGVGRLDVVKSFFDDGRLKANATKEQMKDGFTWACQYGRTNVVEFLLRSGMDVNARLKYNGQTGLHWAAYSGYEETVKLLLERKASVDVKDESYGGTALGWAVYGWAEPAPEGSRDNYLEVVALLRGAGASVDHEWLAHPDRGIPLVEKIRADPRMHAALGGL